MAEFEFFTITTKKCTATPPPSCAADTLIAILSVNEMLLYTAEVGGLAAWLAAWATCLQALLEEGGAWGGGPALPRLWPPSVTYAQ